MRILFNIILLISCFFILTCSSYDPRFRPLPARDSIAANQLKAEALRLQYTDGDSAIKVLGQMNDIYKKNAYKYGNINYYEYATIISGYMMLKPELAKKYADSAWELAYNAPGRKLIYKAHCIYGIYYMSLTDYDNAARHFLLSLKTQPARVDSETLITVYEYLAEIYSMRHDYAAAVRYYQPVLRLAQQNDDSSRQIMLYINMYNCYDPHEANPDARYYLLYAKMLNEKASGHPLSSLIDYTMASYYRDRAMTDSSIWYLEKSLRHHESFDRQERKYLLLAEQYLNKGALPLAAVTLQNIDAQVAQKGLLREHLIKYSQLRYRLYKAEQNTTAALSMLEEVQQKQDQLNEEKSAQQLLQFEKSLHSLENEKTLIINQAVIKQQETYILLLIACFMFAIILLLWTYQYWRNKKNMETQKLVEQQKLATIEIEKVSLQKQINERNRIAQELHDDFGSTLTSISRAVEAYKLNPNSLQSTDIISQSAARLDEQMNAVIWNLNIKNDNLLSLKSYIECFARDFLREAGIQLVWEDTGITENQQIDGVKRRAIYLSAKEILNNMVKHEQADTIQITFASSFEKLQIRIYGNGRGIQAAALNEPRGNGILNLKKNIASINGTIEWVNNKGTSVIIEITLS